MEARGAQATRWQIERDSACLACGSLRGRVEFVLVGVHFRAESWNRKLIDHLSLLFTRGTSDIFQLNLDEWYVRETDLVAQFEKTTSHRISPQIYWRADHDAQHGAASIEMILSMQTELLDSAPQAQVHSFSHGGELWHAESFASARFKAIEPNSHGLEIEAGNGSREHLFLFRDKRSGLSYAQAVHPSDFVSAQVVTDKLFGLWGVTSTLFPEHLEKGVIRRGRICGWFMPAENDLETAAELARQFVEEPLPLTT